ncbi:MAG: GNAT family N-acetyltransferase, partial [Acidobacteriota bacterium]|nr:GNAT family N-acetyltransferase [Acidobacteriota bacterium]
EFLALEDAWRALLERAGVTHPFLEHAWARTWWECFGSGSRLYVIVVGEGDAPIAIAPLIITPVRMFGIRLRRLGFFYNSHVPRADFILTKRKDEALAAIWNTIRASKQWDVLQLCQLTEDSETLAGMRKHAAADQYPTGLWKSGASPRVPLHAGWDAYHQGLPAKHRSNLRNRFKRLDQIGAVELDTVSGGDRRRESLEHGLRLESAAWKGANGTAIFSDPAITRFYEVFSERAAERGWLRLNFLRAGGTAVAFDYSLEYRNRIFLLKLGYDPQFSAYSPSNLLLATALRNSFERGLEEYDFLGEEAEWKRCWTDDTRSNFWLYIFRPSLRAKFAHFIKFRLNPWMKANPLLQRIRAAAANAVKRVSNRYGNSNR